MLMSVVTAVTGSRTVSLVRGKNSLQGPRVAPMGEEVGLPPLSFRFSYALPLFPPLAVPSHEKIVCRHWFPPKITPFPFSGYYLLPKVRVERLSMPYIIFEMELLPHHFEINPLIGCQLLCLCAIVCSLTPPKQLLLMSWKRWIISLWMQMLLLG